MTVTASIAASGYELGRFVAGLTSTQVPPGEVLEKLRCNLLHDLACAMAAHTEGPELWPAGEGRRRRPRRAALRRRPGRRRARRVRQRAR